MDALDAAQALRGRGVPFALATVVRREPPVSARPGDRAVVSADGSLEGWVGGSCAHAAVVTTALRALADGTPRLLVLDPAPGAERRAGVEVFPMACHSGGTLEIYVEPFLPRPRLVLMGASPVAETLARLASAVGYRVFVLDPVATRERFPDAEALFADLHAEAPFGPGETFVLV
ncbi:MAG TPA: XdhC family protein, partial [Thermodesulfobacteriota bacterium]